MKTNPLTQLVTLGQSIWLDYIRRELISGGKLKRLIDEDGLRGMTSNPAIFQKAILESEDYADDIQNMLIAGKDANAIYEALSQSDVRQAADVFRPLYESSDGGDGYVSLEVNPHLAHDAEGTIEEARRLWAALDRPNVFIKVPATRAGLTAIRQVISDGINVNVTLIFGLPRYREVAEAFIAGLEDRAADGKPISQIASVASFFISRIDALVDPQLDEIIAAGGTGAEAAQKARGETAISSAKLAYEIYKEIFGGERFKKLASQGALPQRLLWASTSTKDPSYRDVKYIEALIGPDTVNTAPVETIDAFREHGEPASRLESGLEEARAVMNLLPDLGIDIDQVTQQLEDEGVDKFNTPFDALMEGLAQKTGQSE